MSLFRPVLGLLPALVLGTASSALALPEIPLGMPAEPLFQDHYGTLDWQRFLTEHPGSRILDWDRFHPAPHRVLIHDITLPGGEVRDAADLESRLRAWITGHRDLLPGGELGLLYAGRHEKLWYARFTELQDGLPVYGSEAEFRVSPAGDLLLVGWDGGLIDKSLTAGFDSGAALAAARQWVLAQHPGAELTVHAPLWLPAHVNGRWQHQVALELEVQPPDHEHNWRLWVDGRGQPLWCYDQVRHLTLAGQVDVLAQPVQQGDTPVPISCPHLNLDVDGQSLTTGADGSFSAEVTGNGPWWVSAEFRGPWANVNRQDGTDAFFAWQMAGDGTLLMGEEAHIAERDAFLHTNLVHDFITGIDPGFTGQNGVMPVNVNINQTCNAFYNPGANSINFFLSGGGCPNTAQVAGVLYHEYGHGINHRQYQQAGVSQGMVNGAMHEGLADVNAVLLQDVDFVSPGWNLRALDNNRHYPQDIAGEVHYDGEIVGGAMWDLRLAIGLQEARHLYHFARWGAPDDVDTGRAFFEYFVEVLLADDDNGDLGDQTPHWQQIDDAFNAHGIGSVLTWSMSAFALEQPPIHVTPGTALTLEAEGDIPAFLADGEVLLNWRTASGEWQSVPMTSPDDAVYTATLPAFAAQPWVEVYASLVNGDNSVLFSPLDGPEGPWRFAVSEAGPSLRDFENSAGGLTGDGDWQWGHPDSGPFNAFSGESVWATRLDGDYADDRLSVLQLPPLVATRDGFLALSMMHWLQGDQSGDGGNLQLSRENGDWQVVGPRTGHEFTFPANSQLPGQPGLESSGGGWTALTWELGTDFVSGERLDLRLNFLSNASQHAPGWYLDDLRLLGLSPLPALAHERLPDTEDTAQSVFTPWLQLESELAIETAQLEWRVDGGASAFLPLEHLPDLPLWSAGIPGPFNEQEVEYRFVLAFEHGVELSLPETGWYGFRVGVDQQPPTVAIVGQPANRIGLSGRLVARAQAEDNLGLEQVEAEVRAPGGDWEPAGALVFAGNSTWELDLPYTGPVAGDYELRLQATDQSSASLEALSEPAPFSLGIEEAIDDFESPASEDLWELGGEWALQGQRTYGGSTGALGSSDDGFYDAFSSGTAVCLSTFDLSQASAAWLELREQIFMQPGLDFVHIEVSTNGIDWELLASRTGVQAQWNLASLDLAPWLGSPALHLRWRMQADGSDQGLHVGYFVDNLRLVAEPLTGVEPDTAVPAGFELSSAWPNPFNPSTRVRLDLDRGANVELAVYNVLGQQVLDLARGRLAPGSHEFVIDGSGLASGVYLVRATAGDQHRTRRVVLLK